MTVEQTLERLNAELDSIPPDGEWWKSATQDAFREAARQLLTAGMTTEAIVPLLHGLYWAVAGEFGG